MTEAEAVRSSSWVRLLAAVGSPIALVSALLFYFGWVRTRFQARILGYDPAILDLSLQDYLLKSINVLFLPLVALVIGVLVMEQGHRRLITVAGRNPRVHRIAVRSGRLLVLSWPLWIAAAAILLHLPATYLIAIPASLTAGTLLAIYGHTLARQLDGVDAWPPVTTGLVYILLAFAVFWDTERVARATGEAFARDILAAPQQLVPVTIFSEKPLELARPGVQEIPLRSSSAYTICYRGLRLVEGDDDRFVLVGERGGRIVLLRSLDGVRLEFGWATDPDADACKAR